MTWAAQLLCTHAIKSAELKPDVELQPQQTRVIEKMKKEPGLLVYHGLGSGKTLASIAAGEAIGGERQVVVPASLRGNYRKELEKFVKKPKDYHVQSYQQAIKHDELPEASLTTFDEAHRMGRYGTQLSFLPEKAQGKIMMLTGTPVRNSPSELVPLLRAIAKDRDIPVTPESFDEKFMEEREVGPGFWGWLKGVKPGIEHVLTGQDKLKQLLKGRVDYHPSSGEFPTVKEEHIDVDMTPSQSDLYEALLDSNPSLAYRVRANLPPAKQDTQQLNAFLNAVRQVSNNPTAYDTSLNGHDVVKQSPKMQRMVHEIHKRSKDPEFKALVYSNYLDSGVVPIAAKLTQMGIPNALFTGQMTDPARKAAVEAYNNGKVKALLVSGAGAEGLDLKGTQLVQVMEPHWNQARTDQVLGRAVRHRSHAHLPEELQHVHVQHYYAVPRPSLMQRWGLKEKNTGADKYIRSLATRKQAVVEQLLSVLREVGTEGN